MARAENTQVTETFERFYREYYADEIGELAQGYPTERKSLYLDWDEIYQFDPDLADDLRAQPGQMLDYAEEALRRYDLPVDVKLGQAHVRVRDLPEKTDIRDIRHQHHGTLIAVSGIVRKATDVRPKITTAAFECQRCGTLTRIPMPDGDFQEPHECQGCERQGPFRVNFDQSEFVDAQKLRIQESPEGLRGGETPQSIDVHIEDDVTGKVTAGDHVTVVGVLKLDQQGSERDQSAMFDIFMEGSSIQIDDEEFEEMDISDADKQRIVELSETDNIYEQMVGAIAPSIYGYEQQKLAMVLQLFSGVTKHLPDGSRIRGDMHMLLIGDPGTGKCVDGDTEITLADGRRRPIRDVVEAGLEDPEAVDDGVFDTIDLEVASLSSSGRMTTERATKVWKREAPEVLYRIQTRRGREIEVTPSHPLFVEKEGRLEPVTAENLDQGDFIASPGILRTASCSSLDTQYRKSRSPNAVRLELPDCWTPRLARLVGYIIAEGYATLNDDNSGEVTITNQDTEILTDVTTAFEELDLTYRVSTGRDGKHAKEVICTASEFVSFLEHLEPAILERSADQQVPDPLFVAEDEVRSAFLEAYVDSEGHVSTKERELTVASMSKDLLVGVRSLLLSFGIHGTLEARQNGSYRLRISGPDFERYRREIGFVTGRKEETASSYEEVSLNPNTDLVPVDGDTLRDVRRDLGLSQFDLDLPRSTYQHYERGDRNPSRGNLQRVVERFEERLEWLRETRKQLRDPTWDDVEMSRDELGLSQSSLSKGLDVTQTAVSYYERNDVVPDGGQTEAAASVVTDRIDDALDVASDVRNLRALLEAEVRWDRIESIDVVDSADDWVYDLEVSGTHNYVAEGLVSHNSQLLQYIRNIAPRSVYTSGKGASTAGLTAAAVQDDFGEGQQWSLEAGALVLADQGIAAVDELDKMESSDRSALHEALEQQSVSISKAGINATLKSRCSLLGAANPKYGRFDQYESIGEQIDLEPALISRFDLIFTVTDTPDEEEDAELAEHILKTNYAGELHTHRQRTTTSNHGAEEVAAVTDRVAPTIEPELLRKYVAYAKRNCFPTMTDEAQAVIRDFYVDLRAKGTDEDAPVPVTARKLEALVRLAEASARVRLSDTVEVADAERATDIAHATLEDIGMDPETGEFDADVVETGTSKSQRDRIKNLKALVADIEDEYDEGAPVDVVLERAEEVGMERSKAEHEIDQLKQKGEVYEPRTDHLRTT